MPRPDPDAAPLWAWARWVDSKGRAHTRPDRRYPGFRNQYDGLELLHLRVDETVQRGAPFKPEHLPVARIRDEQHPVQQVTPVLLGVGFLVASSRP